MFTISIGRQPKICHIAIYQIERKNAIIQKDFFRRIVPSERIVCRERNEKNERFRPVAASGTAGSPRGNPEREDVRGAQANPCSVRESAYDACCEIFAKELE